MAASWTSESWRNFSAADFSASFFCAAGHPHIDFAIETGYVQLCLELAVRVRSPLHIPEVLAGGVQGNITSQESPDA